MAQRITFMPTYSFNTAETDFSKMLTRTMAHGTKQSRPFWPVTLDYHN